MLLHIVFVMPQPSLAFKKKHIGFWVFFLGLDVPQSLMEDRVFLS